MKLNKTIALSTVIILGALNLVGCNNSKADTNEKTNIKVGMVSDVGGINDESFNQSAYEGLQQAEKDLGIEIKVIESKQASEYLGNIETLADEGMDLIIGVGNTMAADIKTQAENYPEQQFAIIDETYDEIPENVTPILFKENEASYLTGLIAGKMTETNNVGFIGGMDNTVISRFLYGYMAGVKEANKDAEINVQYAGTFADAAKGKSIANQMYSNKVDIILSAAGGTGLGAIESAKEQNKYAIGVDKDQSNLAPDNVLTSALKKVNVGVYDTVKELKNGKLAGGKEKVYGLKEDGVGIPDSTKKLVPQDIIDYVNTMADKVKNGEIKVPETEVEYDSVD
ncbi:MULTISPECIES: BMP family lipoprotein [Terrisporobacter]|uniref:BMP family ABC transporter substrate-binding protein n=1 Tax=Terrisporobacter muris TaxID=2963284 RepID=A0A9X2M7K2_9FIRM|nr:MULTISPECIES: BMP family ABC transporter substrate-binding protein [Terrisporobacter]MCR1822382.1 BMP family ABC transporter substrate-binding protein [Terrisporobacter muris]MDY3373844.1 BMP family ABC transporter substrate-binding protein [Terrisporobacter othiniensis]